MPRANRASFVKESPPNAVLISLALFLTDFIMAPVLEQSYEAGIAPLMAERIDEAEAFERAVAPVQVFMMQQVREQDLALFLDISGGEAVETPEDIPLRVKNDEGRESYHPNVVLDLDYTVLVPKRR